jgi:hypothetical protein
MVACLNTKTLLFDGSNVTAELVSTPASYSKGSGFKSRPENVYPDMFFRGFLSPPR